MMTIPDVMYFVFVDDVMFNGPYGAGAAGG